MNLKISYKFDTPSVYKDEIYYFPQDKTELVMRSGAPKATIQAIFCCHSGKWRADTFYIEPRQAMNPDYPYLTEQEIVELQDFIDMLTMADQTCPIIIG